MALVMSGPGTNRDRDALAALALAGADPQHVLTAALSNDPGLLDATDLLVIAGGFSYGDSLGAGRMLALDLATGTSSGQADGPASSKLAAGLHSFVESGRPVLGICNGFQVLTRAGLLPGALGHNRSGRFDCRWVSLRPEPGAVSVWLDGDITEIHCPIAHGEGRYVHPDPAALATAGQVALRYVSGNPNGSIADIAGVSDASGVVLGLMPHPENHMVPRQHPGHRRRGSTAAHLALRILAAGVDHARAL